MMIMFLILCAMICYTDIKSRLIPDRVIIFGVLWALTANIGSKIGFTGSLEGFIAGGLAMMFAGSLCMAVYKKPSLGGGDLKLLAMIGAFWGWQVALLTFVIAPVLGSLWAGILNKTKLAYGVFLIVASLIALLLQRFL